MIKIILHALLAALRSRRQLTLENIALRHQLDVLQRTPKRPSLKPSDRAIWAIFSRSIPDWRNHLTIVQPDTVVRWHRVGWRLFWRWRSRRTRGRPKVPANVRTLIRRMSLENPRWGAPQIHGQLVKLGYDIGETTVAKYMVRQPGPPSQTWKTFIQNHVAEIAAVDFFTVPSITFKTLYVFVVLSLKRRQVVHFNVTSNPTATWTRLQLIQSFPFESAPRSPWQNGYCERVIGSIRRECLDHVIVLNERHLRRVLKEYLVYYHESRTHLGLAKDCPVPRAASSVLPRRGVDSGGRSGLLAVDRSV